MIVLTTEEARALLNEIDGCSCPYGSCSSYPHRQLEALRLRVEAQEG